MIFTSSSRGMVRAYAPGPASSTFCTSFDLVISFDAPISYTYPKQEQVLRELVRICRKRLVLSVSSRLGYLPYLANPIQKNQFILDETCGDPFVKWCVEHREEAFRQLLRLVQHGLGDVEVGDLTALLRKEDGEPPAPRAAVEDGPDAAQAGEKGPLNVALLPALAVILMISRRTSVQKFFSSAVFMFR